MSGDRDQLFEAAIYAVVPVAEEYGLPGSRLKPCIAYHLDGNVLDGIPRHHIAFTLAMELRELTNADEERMRAAVALWAAKIGYPRQKATRSVVSALRKTSRGGWRWHPPGVTKKQGTRYAEVLQPICAALGCPANCPAYKDRYVGQTSETYDRFVELAWPRYLRRQRQRAVIDVYDAICQREKQLAFAPGSKLLTTYAQLAGLAGIDKTTVGRALRFLARAGLITFVPGSGSGPYARDRHASEITRVTPIPRTPDAPKGNAPIGAITTGSAAPLKDIGGIPPHGRRRGAPTSDRPEQPPL